jgi:hypothetical protein
MHADSASRRPSASAHIATPSPRPTWLHFGDGALHKGLRRRPVRERGGRGRIRKRSGGCWSWALIALRYEIRPSSTRLMACGSSIRRFRSTAQSRNACCITPCADRP